MVTIPPMPNQTREGEPLAVPEPGTDVAHLIYLLEYCRRSGFKLGPHVQIGSIAVVVTDMRQLEDAGESPLTGPDDPDMELLRQ
jgi:hypothetical protein